MSRLSAHTVRLLSDVLARFGVVPEELHDIRSGRSNKHWRVVAGGRGYALRRYQPGRSMPAIRWEMALLDHVAEGGWPVAAALRSPDGEHVVTVEGVRYALFPFLPGHTVPYARPRYSRLKGGILARLHTTTATWPAPDQRDGSVRLVEPDAALRRAGVGSFDALLGPMAALDRQAATVLHNEWESSVAALSALDLGGLPDIPGHFDFFRDNLLFHRGALSGLLDFDSARLDPRVADIAEAIRLDCLLPPEHDALDPEAIEAFLAGYTEESPLSPVEYRALLPLVWMAVMRGTLYRLVQYRDTGSERALRGALRTAYRRVPAFARDRSTFERVIARVSERPRT